MTEVPDELKAAIMIEVHSQLNPLKVTVDRLNLKMHSLYRNGEGGEGYLERARAEDEEWKKELRMVVEKHGEQLAETSGFVKTHLARDKEDEARQRRREERFKFWAPKIWGAIIAVLGFIASTGITACYKLEPVIKIMWQDYLKDHPDAAQTLKKTSSLAPEKLYSEQKEPQQDAGISANP